MGNGVEARECLGDSDYSSLLFAITRGLSFLLICVPPGHQMKAVPLMTCAYSKQEVRKRGLLIKCIFT